MDKKKRVKYFTLFDAVSTVTSRHAGKQQNLSRLYFRICYFRNFSSHFKEKFSHASTQIKDANSYLVTLPPAPNNLFILNLDQIL